MLASGVYPSVEILLDFQVLYNCFDHQVAFRQQAQIIIEIACLNTAGISLVHQRGRVGLKHIVHSCFGQHTAVGRTIGDHVEQNDRYAGVSDMGCDTGAHDTGSNHSDLVYIRHTPTVSITVAIPWPPPMH